MAILRIPRNLSELLGTISAAQHAAQTDETLHAAATAGGAGFMAAADKDKLDQMPAVVEASLGVPASDGYVLSSTVAGTRSWIAPGGGVSDHGALTGLADDDHPQYHNDTRGDARYGQLAAANTWTEPQTLSGEVSIGDGLHIPYNPTQTDSVLIFEDSNGDVGGRMGVIGGNSLDLRLLNAVASFQIRMPDASTAMRVLSSGNVGFGTQGPSGRVHVVPAAGGARPLVVSGTTSQTSQLIHLRQQSSTGTDREAASIDARWLDSTDATRTGAAYISTVRNAGALADVARFDQGLNTAGYTGLMLWDVDTGALRRVRVGANDSAGAGFRTLMLPN